MLLRSLALLAAVAACATPAPRYCALPTKTAGDTTNEVLVQGGPPETARPRVIIHFEDELDAAMGDRLLAGIQAAVDQDATEVTILINSPGGRVDYMFAIYDALRTAERSGVTSRCVVLPDGYAASAAAFIFEGCSERVMAPSARLLFHEVGTGAGYGKKGDFRRLSERVEDVDMRIAVTLAPRLHMTAAEFYAWVNGRDRWLDAAGALEKHAVDKVE